MDSTNAVVKCELRQLLYVRSVAAERIHLNYNPNQDYSLKFFIASV